MYVFAHCTDVAMRRYIVCSEGRSRNGFITGMIFFFFFFSLLAFSVLMVVRLLLPN